MRMMGVVVTAVAVGLSGCGSGQKGAKPVTTLKSVRPASITISPESHWEGAPTAGSMPVFTDLDNVIENFPPALKGTIVIQRSGREEGSAGYLQGKVTVPTEATLYVALLEQADEERLITPVQLAGFEKEGWVRVPGIFAITEPPGHRMRWSVWRHDVPEGPVVIESKAVPQGGIFFIGKVRG